MESGDSPLLPRGRGTVNVSPASAFSNNEPDMVVPRIHHVLFVITLIYPDTHVLPDLDWGERIRFGLYHLSYFTIVNHTIDNDHTSTLKPCE